MWGMFFFASLVAVVFLYLVGFLVLRGLRFSILLSVAAAPIVSTLCFEILAIIYDKANVWASWATLFVPALVLGVALFVAGALARRRSAASLPAYGISDASAMPAFDMKMIALYAGLGLVVGLLVFVRALDGPECFNETYDNLTHLGLVRSFVEQGHYSTLNATQYRDLGMAGSYYPAAWHMVTAMVCSALGASNLLATNAMNYVCCALVYPISCLCLIRAIFGTEKHVVIAGAFASIGFVTFPWFFVVYGVLESNLFGFIMVPVMLVFVMRLFSAGGTRAIRMRCLAMCILSVAFCFFAQPNAFFAVVLFAIPYLAWRIWQITGPAEGRPRSLKVRLAIECAFLLAVAVVWCICYKAPFLYDVTHFGWDPGASKAQAVVDTLLFSNAWSPAAPVVAVLVMVGLLTLLKERKHAWVAMALGVSAVVFWVGLCLTGTIDQVLTGFWYSDWRRTAALQAMIAVPVAALGIARIYEALPAYLKANAALRSCMGIILLALLFFPSFSVRDVWVVQTPFGYFSSMMDELYSMDQTDDEIIFSEAEREFAAKAKEVVGDDVVYNIPYDGSFLAYQTDGLRTIYRLPYTGWGETADQKVIQSRLSEYATNDEVKEALANTGARYVMMLDYGHIPYHDTWPEYYPDAWKGITAIDEDTPGFEPVLSEGDMRLYKIEEMQ